MVGGEVSSGGVRRRHHINLVHRSGGDTVICFRMPVRTEGGGGTLSVAAHSVRYGGGCEKGKLVQFFRKCNEYRG